MTWAFPPPLGDKMRDWDVLTAAGGQEILRARRVAELGPGFGFDAFMHAHITESYTIFDSDRGVLNHLQHVKHGPNEQWMKNLYFRDWDLRRTPWAADHDDFDVVLDFSTIDDLQCGLEPYREAVRILKPDGILITTFANEIVFGRTQRIAEQRFHPDAVRDFLHEVGCVRVVHAGRELARTGIIAIKVK